ncbi:MAG: hypothetical protein EXR52_02830 [Dehalococcoidia bacterium]|nr:hypothetical protein [Dehalococcoidia bacterium]
MNSQQPVEPTISVVDLLNQHVLDAAVAGLLWALLARRASLLAVAGYYSGAGKTTTMVALSSFYPAGTALTVARGRTEDFAFVREATPERTTVLVPEFSDHTPAYLWGRSAAQVFELRAKGFSFAGTMHGNGVEDVLTQLVQPPVSLHPSTVASALQIILTQNMIEEIQERRVTGVSWAYPNPRGPAGLGVKGLVAWNPRDDLWHRFSSPETWQQLAAWGGAEVATFEREVQQRSAFLSDLQTAGITVYQDVHERIATYHL